VTISVKSLVGSAGFYRKLCGPETRRGDGELVFKIGADTLVVREAPRPGIDHFHVLVEGYDRAEAMRRMRAVGKELQVDAKTNAPYFIDPDGIIVYLADRQSE
jgi:hypothetical protein